MFVLSWFFTEAMHLPFASDNNILAAGCLFLRLFWMVLLYNIMYYENTVWKTAKQILGLLCSWLRHSSWSCANPVYSGRSTVGEMGGNSKGMIVLSLEVWVIVIASSYLSKLITYTRLCMFCSFRFWVLWSWGLEYGFWPTKPVSLRFYVRLCFFISLFLSWFCSGAVFDHGVVRNSNTLCVVCGLSSNMVFSKMELLSGTRWKGAIMETQHSS